MKKYYTPRVEEFMVNFKYEYKTWKGWSQMTMDSFNHRPNGTMNLQYDLVLNKDKFRVKYLDRQDIESFGFKYNKELEVIDVEGEKCQLYSMPTTYNLIKYNHLIEISEGYHTIFKGIIKNKSELERILKIINV